jgi:hypothetical protein
LGVRKGKALIQETKKLRLVFHDSYKILPMSLQELSKTFGCNVQKGTFPHEQVTYDFLSYIGEAPKGFIPTLNEKV